MLKDASPDPGPFRALTPTSTSFGLLLLPLQLLLLVDFLQVEVVDGDEARVSVDGRIVGQHGWHQSRRVRRVRSDGLLPIREHDGRCDLHLGILQMEVRLGRVVGAFDVPQKKENV